MHHECGRGNLQRNPVGRQWQGAQPAQHNRRGPKQRHLGQSGYANRPAQPKNPAQRLGIGAPKAFEQRMFGCGPCRVDRQQHRRYRLHRHRGPSRPANAHFRRAPMAKYQRVIHENIHHHRSQCHPKHHLRALKRGKVGFQHHHQQRRENTPARNTQILLRALCHHSALAQAAQHPARPPKQRHAGQPKGHRDP